ncbi:MAG: hypothetical protein R3F33_12955 [Planctomycetota bacterium]
MGHPFRYGLGLWLALCVPVAGALGQAADAAGGDGLTPDAVGQTAPGPEPEAVAPPVEPWHGGFQAGLDEMARLAREENLAAAEGFAQRLLEPLGGNHAQERWQPRLARLGPRAVDAGAFVWASFGQPSRSAEQRAVVQHNLGVLQADGGAPELAAVSFDAARRGSPGDARLASTYNLGCLALEQGEAEFDQIPEVHGRTRSAMSPGFVPSTTNGDEEEPDHLKLAKKAYEEALDYYRERLLLDWRDDDTRANVQWIQQRLDRLREIEEKRKSDEGQGKAQDDPSQQDQDQEDQNQEDQSGEKGAQKQEQEQEQQEPKDPSEQEQQNQSEQQGDEAGEQPPPDPDASDNQSEEPKEDQEFDERYLTEEEIQRLLKQLEAHEAEGERLKGMMKIRPRGNPKKDW